ncbi:MAG: glycosyltransferase family 2 protein [Alphaproteobacteria bacterium]|nr:glycosyltransferase family 2 protein [Alphaproteobacteria bacterium]
MSKKLLIYIVAYNAEKHIKSQVLDLIPYDQLDDYEILVSDDSSSDKTSDEVEHYKTANPDKKILLVTQPKNLGYGGNQKFGYNYVIKNAFDAVVMIHGDGQYSPTLIPQIATPLLEDRFDVMLGSRMINKKSALKGGMPLYKFIGNIVLTKIQNLILGVTLSEYHTGLRAYRIKALEQIPFLHNNNGFSFDTDILIQMIDQKMRIGEVAIPTHYGDEICRVNSCKYAYEIIISTILSRLQKLSLWRSKKFTY